MAKTLAYYIDQAEAANGGRFDDRTDPIELVNDAGQYMLSMADWKFLERPPASLNFVAATNYIVLPTDFGQMIRVEVPNALQNTVEMSTLQEIEYLRGSPLNDPFRYVVAVEYATQTNDETIGGTARLAIWPTPAANATAALRLIYRGGWVTLTDQDKIPNIPLDVEGLLVQVVRAYGRASGNKAIVLDDLLRKIEAGPIFQNLVSSYGTVQLSLGQMSGGAVQVGRGGSYPYRPFRSITR